MMTFEILFMTACIDFPYLVLEHRVVTIRVYDLFAQGNLTFDAKIHVAFG